MNKFTEGTTLCERVTPTVIVTEQDHVNSRKVYTESLTKKQKRLKSIKDYKNDLSFQNLFSHLKFYTKEPGTKTPDILMNNNDWDETCDTEAWIGIRKDQSTNTKTEIWIDDKYVHHVCIAATIDRCIKYCNKFVKLSKVTTFFLAKQCALWRNEVKTFKINRKVVTEADATNKSE